MFEAIRNKEKTGTIVGVHQSLKPVLVAEYNDEVELIVVEVKVANKEIQIISGVGPQEN